MYLNRRVFVMTEAVGMCHEATVKVSPYFIIVQFLSLFSLGSLSPFPWDH